VAAKAAAAARKRGEKTKKREVAANAAAAARKRGLKTKKYFIDV